MLYTTLQILYLRLTLGPALLKLRLQEVCEYCRAMHGYVHLEHIQSWNKVKGTIDCRVKGTIDCWVKGGGLLQGKGLTIRLNTEVQVVEAASSAVHPPGP